MTELFSNNWVRTGHAQTTCVANISNKTMMTLSNMDTEGVPYIKISNRLQCLNFTIHACTTHAKLPALPVQCAPDKTEEPAATVWLCHQFWPIPMHIEQSQLLWNVCHQQCFSLLQMRLPSSDWEAHHVSVLIKWDSPAPTDEQKTLSSVESVTQSECLEFLNGCEEIPPIRLPLPSSELEAALPLLSTSGVVEELRTLGKSCGRPQ